jgi:hypothetical protein
MITTEIIVPNIENSTIDPKFLKNGRFCIFNADSNRIGGKSYSINRFSNPPLMVVLKLDPGKNFINNPMRIP